MIKFLNRFALISVLVSCAHAKDMGVQGNTWPIVEVDIRQMMVESAARANWGEAQTQAVDSAKQYLANLPKRRMGSPDKTQTTWMDPSISISSDIQAPVKQANGSFKWEVMHANGTKVNPLEKYRPVTAMLLFDGSDPDQLKAVKEVLAREPNRIVPVEAGAGDLKSDNDALKRPVFYANDAMMNRFQVRYLPTLIYPGTGAQELLIGIASFAAPYAPKEILTAWPALKATPVPTVKKASPK